MYDEDPNGRSHYQLLRRYLKLRAELNVFISPKKFEVYIKDRDIAGHVHGDGGLRPSSPRYQAVVEAPDPTTVADVYHGVSAMGWSRPFIPNFTILERPLRAFVFAMKALNGGAQTIRRAKNKKLKDYGWMEELHNAYLRLNLSLICAMKRAYRNPDMIPVLMWDAFKFAWSYTIFQI